ncbi:hypothetical protein BKA61DRAFT_679545 [Leptodontidium sp. MPI-SDFR-AT-0119]|nr:hypothetical protein BKA61DRAFT_679545 [Leptodontidium sp. MPI-SDFR-AT-0119]
MVSIQCDCANHFDIDTWLATACDWLANGELCHPAFGDIDATPPQSPSPTRFQPSRSQPLHRKRKRSMSSDAASTASGQSSRTTSTTATSANVFGARRPIRSPTPPSTTRGRSSSPHRKVLSQLRKATPSAKVCQPDAGVEQPLAVKELRSMLIENVSSKVIPHALQARLRSVDPDQFPSVKIYREARLCHDNHLDEGAWMRAVAKVFEVAEGCGQTTPMLRLDNIQTQAIDPYLLPRHVSSSFAKKADLALAFSPDHPAVAARLEPVQKSYPDLALSQMTDACTSTVPLKLWSQTRRGDGSIPEEQGQKMEKDLPPFVGWTIVGHDWKFHIAWKDKSGNVTVLGPWRILNAGTGSHSEILILFALIKTVKQWLEKEYWTWICGNVLNGLGADSNM